jgi:Uma2 family endonuclease
MTIAEPTVRRWTREEYYLMGEAGIFQEERVELIDGEIIQMAPQKDTHALAVGLCNEAVRQAFGSGYWVRVQLPLSLGPGSEPEPDISVVRGTVRDYSGKGHPTSALLVIEVSDTTLLYDRSRKQALYAAWEIADYWIVNLQQPSVEVYRQPIIDGADWRRSTYQDKTVLHKNDAIAPLAMPQQQIAVADLLP